MGLAGACRSLTSSMFVGAPLPCTASRCCSYYILRCCCLLVQQKDWFEWRNLFPPATCGCRATPKGHMRRLCRGLLPLQRKMRQSSATGAAPDAAARPTPPKHGGGPGGSVFFASPRRLCARGSMTLRRAKAASLLYINPIYKKTQTNSTNLIFVGARSHTSQGIIDSISLEQTNKKATHKG